MEYADILANNPKIQGDEYEIKGCEAVVQSVLYWQMQLDLVKGKKTDEHTRQVLVPEELSETANRWSLPMIKTKNSSGVQIEAMLEEGEIPIWSSNFKAENVKLGNQYREGGWSNYQALRKWYSGWSNKRPIARWNHYYDKLKLNGVDNLPESFTIGWIKLRWFGEYYVGLNNPLYANSKISTAYSITLSQPIVIKPTKIDMNENITNVEDDDLFFYKKITQEIIDPNTKQCVRYPESEFVLEDGKKQCVGGEESIDTEEKVVNDKKEIVKKYDSEGNPICKSGVEYQKHNDWNEAKKGQCKTQDIRLYTTGVAFTPNYDESPIDISKQYCKSGETQSFETIEEKTYEMPDDDDEDKLPYEVDENGNPIEMADGESSYYKYIQQYKNNALNVNNYNKTITKVLCTADNEDSNMNAYIIGAVMNLYHSTKLTKLTKLEIESLNDMKMDLYIREEWEKKHNGAAKGFRLYKKRQHKWESYQFNFTTKKKLG